MKFTICIPAYNQQEYLPEAIESALNQTVQCEVIVVIDGSPDESETIARTYPVKVVRQVNKGLASARNAGIMNMTEDIFLPLDSDDMLQVDCVEKMQQVFEETGIDVVAPSMKCFGEAHDTIIIEKNPTLDDFRTTNRIPYASAIKREALLECGGYSPKYDSLGGWEDYALWFDLLTRGKKIVGIQEPLLLYRTKQKSMWRESLKNAKALHAQLEKDFPNVWPKS